jgi:hypothetical protein
MAGLREFSDVDELFHFIDSLEGKENVALFQVTVGEEYYITWEEPNELFPGYFELKSVVWCYPWAQTVYVEDNDHFVVIGKYRE